MNRRDIEGLLAERETEASDASVRLWCNTSGLPFSKPLRRRHPRFGTGSLPAERREGIEIHLRGARRHRSGRELRAAPP
jgi:hypothetical protein